MFHGVRLKKNSKTFQDKTFSTTKNDTELFCGAIIIKNRLLKGRRG
jgi:hypothetical protein